MISLCTVYIYSSQNTFLEKVIGYEIHLCKMRWMSKNASESVVQIVCVCVGDVALNFQIVMLSCFVFTCCDPFWLVFEILHLSFSFLRSYVCSFSLTLYRFTWQAKHVIEIFCFNSVELFPVSLFLYSSPSLSSFLFLQLIVQFNSLSIKVFSVWMVFSSLSLSFYLLFLGSTSKLMLPIWQVSRKMDIRSTVAKVSSMFCVVSRFF